MKIRKPYWVGKINLRINNKQKSIAVDEQGFIIINKTWKEGDKVELQLPMALHTEAMPDNPNRIAFLYGPLVLAGKLSEKTTGTIDDTAILVADKNQLRQSVQQQNKKLVLTTAGIAKPVDIDLGPLYQITSERQAVYFDIYTAQQWQQTKTEIESEQVRQAAIEKRTTDMLRIGEMQPERDHNLLGE